MQSFLDSQRGMKFTFPDTWNVVQYDKEPFYTERIMPNLQQAKAIDFLCCDNTKLIFIEAKLYKEKNLEDVQCLVQEVCMQFKDTIFGLTVAHVSNDTSLKLSSNALLPQHPTEHHKIELFVELAHEKHLLNKMANYKNILDKVKMRFAKFGFAVRVLHSQNMQNHPWKAEVL